MPLTLYPPKPGRTPNWRIRGSYLGICVDETTGTPEKAVAQKLIRAKRDAIERGAVARPGEPTFASAAEAYLDAGGEQRFIAKLNDHFGDTPLSQIDQAAIDRAAVLLYPDAMPATRNRQVYAPVSQILKRAGVTMVIQRPRGAAGKPRHVWLQPPQFERLVKAAQATDAEFAVLIVLLYYTGLRLGEALRLGCADVQLAPRRSRKPSSAFCGRTKNGDARAIHLPPRVVSALGQHPRGLARQERLFRWSKGSELYLLAERVYAEAGVDHGGAPFHIFRHSYGAMMTRAGANLVATQLWRSETAARVYKHFVTNEEARKADLIPGARAPHVQKGARL